ncbi:MAG: hypothetical protein ACD_3C00188G0020 [uncultured bacterium (gcode 4)]|uniref:Uncharacterized protein n=1 Tax=uncultured bacterium (gcode 4) TaxID=1234023 RepID=K2GBP5_9BACT|nr:MAG: hypothetical protein ACD_3C00188G0020 [uncultured bacterium (gcode 4)]
MWKVEAMTSRIKSYETKEILEILSINNDLTKDESKEIFLFLYDYTNSFKNANTTPDILRLAWIVLESWIQHDQLIVDKTKQTFSQMKLSSDMIEGIQLYKDDTIAGTYVSKQMQANHGVETFDWWSFVSNILITISNCIFWFLLIELGDSEYRILLGSKFDINPLPEIMARLWIDEWNDIVRWKTKEELIEIITG